MKPTYWLKVARGYEIEISRALKEPTGWYRNRQDMDADGRLVEHSYRSLATRLSAPVVG